MEWLLRVEHIDGWPDPSKAAYEIFNILTGLGYFTIAVELVIFYVVKKKKIEEPYVLVVFAIFLSLCAMIRLGEVIVLGNQRYNAFLVLYFITTIAVIVSAAILPKALINISKLKTPKEYQQAILDCEDTVKRKEELEKSQDEMIHALQEKIDMLEKRIVEKDWYIKTHEEVRDLQRILLKANTPPSDPNLRVPAPGG